MRKRPEWESCGGFVVCTACQSTAMEWLDARVRSGVAKRETRCLDCGARRTTPLTAPGLPAPGTSLAPVPAAVEPSASLASPAPARPSIELLDLAAILPDSVQPREQLDLLTAQEYAQQMMRGDLGQVVDRRGEDWPPIVVYRELGAGSVRLADGFHRVKGAELAGLAAIQAEVRVGGAREALLYALGANAKHGQRMTNADKRRIVMIMLEDAEWGQLSDSRIASHCGVTQPFVSKLHGELRQRIKAAEAARAAVSARVAPPPTLPPPAPASAGAITVMAPVASAPTPAPQIDLEEMIAARRAPHGAEQADVEAAAKRLKQDQRDSWSTDPVFLEKIVRPILGAINLDPASNALAQEIVRAERWISAEEDGLTQRWHGNVWLNPPYSHPLVEEFADKALAEWDNALVGKMLILVNSQTAAGWWHKLGAECDLIAYPDARLEFWSPHGLESTGNRNAQTLFYFGPQNTHKKVADLLKAQGFLVTKSFF